MTINLPELTHWLGVLADLEAAQEQEPWSSLYAADILEARVNVSRYSGMYP